MFDLLMQVNPKTRINTGFKGEKNHSCFHVYLGVVLTVERPLKFGLRHTGFTYSLTSKLTFEMTFEKYDTSLLLI